MNKQNPGCESDTANVGYGAQSSYTISGGSMLGDCVMRQNARAVIRDRIGQLRTEAARLEALLDALPAKMPPDADQALWDLAIAARRG